MSATRSVGLILLGLVGLALVIQGAAQAYRPGVQFQFTLIGGLCFFVVFVVAISRR